MAADESASSLLFYFLESPFSRSARRAQNLRRAPGGISSLITGLPKSFRRANPSTLPYMRLCAYF
jgi:hypothetical protein